MTPGRDHSQRHGDGQSIDPQALATTITSFLAETKPRQITVGGAVVNLGTSRSITAQGHLVEVTRDDDGHTVISVNEEGSDQGCWDYYVTPAGQISDQVGYGHEHSAIEQRPRSEAPLPVERILHAMKSWIAADTAAAEVQRLSREPNSAMSATVTELVDLTRAIQLDLTLGSRAHASEHAPGAEMDEVEEGVNAACAEAAMRDAVDAALLKNVTPVDTQCSVSWSEACEKLGLPVEHFRTSEMVHVTGLNLPFAPSDLLDAIDGSALTPDMCIVWHGKQYLVVALVSTDIARPFRIGDIVDRHAVGALGIVPVAHVIGRNRP